MIDFFTAETGLFLRHLKCFSNIENIHINQQLAELLREAYINIKILFDKVEVLQTPDQTVVDLIFGFDEQKYCLRRFLECRLCGELIKLSTEEFEAHIKQNHEIVMSNNNFSPISISQNKMATNQCDIVDLNQNLVLQSSDDETTNLKYSDVISNMAAQNDASRNISPRTTQDTDEHSENQTPDISVDSGYGTSYFLKVRGLPWKTTKTDLLNFFVNVHISNGLDGIHFITDDQNNYGVAYIQVPTLKDYKRARTYHRKQLGDRYIEVLETCKQDLGDLQKHSTEDNVLRLEGLPWDSKETEIRQFFSGLNINEIGLILDETTNYTLEAFVLFATNRDFDMALKRNWEFMGNRHVKIFRSCQNQMNIRLMDEKKKKQQRRIAEEKHVHTNVDNKQKHSHNQNVVISLPIEKILERKPQTEEWKKVDSRRTKSDAKKATNTGFHMVLARGFQWKVTKEDVMQFFKGIKILNGEKGINIIKNVAMEAYVELATKADVKKALALNKKLVDDRTVHVTEVDSKEYGKVASCISQTNTSKVVQIRGLPWTVDKADIIKLFPKIKIQKNRIKIEVDENQRRTGYAFVEFDSDTDYETAFKADVKASNKFIKLFKATKEQYNTVKT